MTWVIDHWPIFLYFTSLIVSIVFAFFFTKKILIPRLEDKVSNLQTEIETLEEKFAGIDGFVTQEMCDQIREECQMNQCEMDQELKENVDKVLACVQKQESKRQTSSKVFYAFMVAVKEKLDLKFDVPTEFIQN